MADLTPPASQNNTPMRPLGPADDLDHPTSPTRATSSSQDPSAINATALRGSTLGVGTPEHDVDMDEELATSGAIPTYDTAEAHGEASPDYDGVSEDEYSQSDISGDELNREPLLSDGGSDEGMVDEDAKVEDEEQREDDAELEALPATTSSDDKGKSNMDGEVPGQQPGRPKRGTRSSRLRAAASQAPDAKGAKGFRNAKSRPNRRGNDDRMRGWPGQAQGGPLEGGKKDELLEQDTVRGWNRSFGDPFYSKELEARVKRQLGREQDSAMG